MTFVLETISDEDRALFKSSLPEDSSRIKKWVISRDEDAYMYPKTRDPDSGARYYEMYYRGNILSIRLFEHTNGQKDADGRIKNDVKYVLSEITLSRNLERDINNIKKIIVSAFKAYLWNASPEYSSGSVEVQNINDVKITYTDSMVRPQLH